MNPFFQFREFTYHIKGLDREYKLFHISDIHIGETIENSSRADIESAKDVQSRWKKGRLYFGKLYGDIMSDEHTIPLEGYYRMYVDYANELNPDAVICTGDILDRFTESSIEWFRRENERLKVPFILCRGNHDTGCHPVYMKYMLPEITVGNLHIVSFDNSQKRFSEEDAARLRKVREPSVLMMHMPVRTAYNSFLNKLAETIGDYYYVNRSECDEPSAEFIDYYTSDECPASLLLFGHIHGCTESDAAPGKTELSASSTMLGGGNIIHLLP